MSLHCDCVEEGRTCDGIVCAGRIRKSGVAKTRWNTLKPKRHTTICLLQQLYLLAIALHIGCLPMALAGKSSLEPDTSNLPAWRNQKAQLSSNIVPRDPVITLPQRTRSQNNTLPTLSLFFPIPDLSARSAALVSSMIMTLDDIQTAILPSLWVDLVVSVVNNRSDAINQAKFAITNKKVSGFVGNAQYAEIVDVADQYNLPICDGSDDSILLSNHADYPMFFRTRPTDKNQIRAIYSFVSSRGWNQISIVTSSDFADSSLFFTEASAYGLEIKATFMIESLTSCIPVSNQISSSNAPVLVYFGVPTKFSAACFSVLNAKSPYASGYSWITDDDALQSILDQNQTLGTFTGVFGVSVKEGTGDSYTAVLNNWIKSSYQNRYPYISLFKAPPRGFMFYRTCLELLLQGYQNLLSNKGVTTSQLTSGANSAWSDLVSIPQTFSTSRVTVTGQILFINNTGDRAGFFDINYCNGTSFSSIGTFNESQYLSVNETQLAMFGWSKPSLGTSGISPVGLAFSIIGAIIGALLIVYLIFYCRKQDNKEDPKEESDFTNPVALGIVTGTGQQALNILQRLKDERIQHHHKPVLTLVEIDIITDALTSVGNNAYNPTFETSVQNGSTPVDQEVQEFLLSTMLAQVKRNTAEIASPRESDHTKSHAPGMKREKSLLAAMIRTPSEKSLVVRKSEEHQLHSTPEGPPRESDASDGFDPNAKWGQKSLFRATTRSVSTRRLSDETESRAPRIPSIQHNNQGDSVSPETQKPLVTDVHRSQTSKQSHQNGKSRAPSIYSGTTISRRISTFAQVFNPNPLPLPPREPSAELIESPSASNLSLSFLPDLSRKFEDFDVLIRPARDLSQINVSLVQEYLDVSYFTWNIDMFRLCKISEGHPLYYSGSWLIEKTDLLPKFRIETDKFKHWLLLMEKEYRPLPYHNCIHASDVLQSFYFLAFHSQWGSKFTPIEKLAGIIAAVGHDIDHPGLSNQFLVKARDPSAIMYSDASVNEYHHSAHMFSITLASQYNIFANLTSEEYDEMRRIIIKLILATDMGKHFEMLSKFKTKIQSSGFRNLDTQENRLMVLEIALKCGDLNNPSRCQEIAVQWAHCIMEEFYRQGDKEKELGFPISNFMDRHNSNVAKCQVGFIDLLVAPLYGTWALFNKDDPNNSAMKSNIHHNKKLWQQVSNIQADPNFSQIRSTVGKSVSSIASSVVQKPPPMPPLHTTIPAVPNVPEIFVMKTSGKSLTDLERVSTEKRPLPPPVIPPEIKNDSVPEERDESGA